MREMGDILKAEGRDCDPGSIKDFHIRCILYLQVPGHLLTHDSPEGDRRPGDGDD